MLRRWTRYLPFALIVWAARRKCERIDVEGEMTLIPVYKNEALAFRNSTKQS